jgi:uncharacterized protein (TIGR02145 family)
MATLTIEIPKTSLPNFLAACLTLALAFTHSHSSDGKPAIGSFTDARDGKKYKTVKIGEQTWMAENLNYKASKSKCYKNSEFNCKKYGRLYDWDIAMKVCPLGWHLPSKDEWEILSNSVDGNKTDGKHLKSASGWNENGNGQDSFGFSALPGGFGYFNGRFNYAGYTGYWWSGSEYDSDSVYGLYINCDGNDTNWNSSDKDHLLSVRCIKD